MAVYGLDVGTNAVRVAEVEAGDPPRLRAFGQVALPLDAVREGEVIDGPAVAAAIQRLWRELGLRRRAEVRVGLASPRVILRPVELPAMPEAELAGALRYQAQELIPIPIDDARLDFQVLETVTTEEGEQFNRLLLAAAHRDAVDRLRAAVEAAQLRVRAVDLVPAALVRGAGTIPRFDEPAGAEAIVSLGAGTTVVVVHERGISRFARILATAGRGLTDAVAAALGVDLETAEALKRGVPDAPADQLAAATAALQGPIDDLLEEVRGSLDYYRTQPGATPLTRVVLTGGTSLLPDLPLKLGALVALPVDLARPRDSLILDDLGFEPEQIPLLDPYLPVPVGLALGGLPQAGRELDLLGGASRPAGDARKIALVAAAVGIVLVGALGYLSWQRSQELDEAKQAKTEQEAANRALQEEIDGLSDVAATQQQIEAQLAPIETILQTDVSWSGVLTDLAIATPSDSWLTAFQGSQTLPAAGEAAPAGSTATTAATTTTAAGGAATPTEPATPTISGQVSFSADALGFQAVADWITQYEMVKSFTNIWVPNATREGVSGQTGVVTFSANAVLTPEARSRRLECLQDLADGESCSL